MAKLVSGIRSFVVRHPFICNLQFAICALLILVFTVYFSWLAITRHMMFRSSAMDLGYTTQVVWNTLHGRPFEFSTYENAPIDLPLEQFKRTDNLLGYHVELLLAPISLLYLVYASPVTLLVLQVIGVALGALPAFWLARRRLASGFAGLAFAAAYLLAPALNGAVLSDFHAVSLTAALFLFAFYFLEEQRPWAFLAMILLALSAKEDVPLLVFMLGLYSILSGASQPFARRRRRMWLGEKTAAHPATAWRNGRHSAQGAPLGMNRRLGIATALLGLSWFLVATRVIQPHFNGLPASPFLARMAIFGPTIEATIRNALADPGLIVAWLTRGEVLTYLAGLAATGGFLSLFSPLTAAIGAPILAINIFSNWDWTYSEGAHYSASLIPFVIVSAIYGAEFVAYQAARRTRLRFRPVAIGLAALVLVSSLAHQWQIGMAPFSRSFQPPRPVEHHRLGQELIARIPAGASVSAQANLYPHIAHRPQAYLFPAVNDAEYILLDVTSSPFPLDVAALNAEIQFLLERGEYGVIAARDGYLLLRRGASHGLRDATWAAFLTFAREPQPPRFTTGVRFGDALELVGYDYDVHNVVTAGQLPATVATYWRALRPLDADYELALFFTRGDGAIVGEYAGGTATLAWYPARAWQPGETIRIETPVLAIGRDLGVLVGVRPPEAANDDRGARPAPSSVPGGATPAANIIAGERLVELFRFGH